MSEEELRKTLKDCVNELCLRCGQYKERHLGSCDGCRWKMVQELATNLQPTCNNVATWISVKERLPDENEDVLIYGEWTGVSGTKYREVWLTDLREFLHQGYKPIAWMPLPTPPKGDERC